MLVVVLTALPSLAWSEQGKVTLEITGQDGVPVETERYVAVFERNARWTEPLREALIASGKPLPTWKISPGRYMIYCSAAGFGYKNVPPFDLAADDARHVRCELPRLSLVQGRVISASDGTPLSGARIAHTWLLDVERLYRVTPLGEEHLARNFSSTTDQQGVFLIGTVPGTRTSLWVEAASHAGREVFGFEVEKGIFATPIGDIPLTTGGALEVRLTGTKQYGDDRVLSLRRLNSDSGLERDRGIGSRVRPLPSDGEAVVWQSLEPGLYEVWLDSRDKSDSLLPLVVGSYQVHAGDPTRVMAGLPKAGRQEDPGLELLIPADIQAKEIRALQWAGARLEEASSSLLDEPQRLLLAKGCRRDMVTILVGKGAVSRPYVFRPETCRASEGPVRVEAELFTAGEVRGEVVPPFGFSLPDTASLRVDRCANESWEKKRPMGTFPATIDEEGGWKAVIPAGCRDFSLSVATFAPLQWEGVTVLPEAKYELGSRRLKPGGSVLVRVVSAEDGRGVEGARVDILEEISFSAAVKATIEEAPLSSVATEWTDVHGWAHIDSLPPGTLALRALDQEGRRAGFTRSFQLDATEERVLPDLELASLGGLVIRVTDPVGDSPAHGEVLVRGMVNPADCGWELGFQTTVGLEGSWIAEITDLLAGPWRVVPTIVGENGKVELDPVEVHIGSGQTEEIEVEVTGTSFNGVVTLADQPVSGELQFRAPSEGTLTSRSTSDENGRFSVLLPSSGRYDVGVFGDNLGVTVPGVDFADPDEVVQIELPAGTITGVTFRAQWRDL